MTAPARAAAECAHENTVNVSAPRPARGALSELGWLERDWRCLDCGHTATMRFRPPKAPARKAAP